MATGAQTVAGTVLGVSSALPSSEDSTGYAALTFTDIGEITDMGSYGKEYNEVTFNPIDDRKTYKFKGSYNQGSMTISLGRVTTDGGQTELLTALDSDADVAFEVAFQDGSIQYFSGKVMSYTTEIGGVDSILTASVTIGINTDIIEVAAP